MLLPCLRSIYSNLGPSIKINGLSLANSYASAPNALVVTRNRGDGLRVNMVTKGVATDAPAPGGAVPRAAKDAVLALDGDGMVRDCNPASEALFKYPRAELVGQHISSVLPEINESKLIHNGRPNPRLHFLSHIGRAFMAVARDGYCFDSQLFLNCLGSPAASELQLIVRPVLAAARTPGRLERSSALQTDM